jgi:hypothetical protein
MTKRLLTISFTFASSVVLILGLVTSNCLSPHPAAKPTVMQADGVPLPPPPPTKPTGGLIADGVPLPPPPPKPKPLSSFSI